MADVSQPIPLTVDKVNGLYRPVTMDDVRRWEHMELAYANLLRTLRDAVVQDSYAGKLS